MDCAEAREILSSFNDREATVAEKAAVEEHLRTCKDCAFESTMIVGLKRLFGHWDGVRATESFKADLLERVKQEPEPGRLSHVNWRVVSVGAAAVVVVVALWFVIRAERFAGGDGASAARPVGASGERREGEIVLPESAGPSGSGVPRRGTLMRHSRGAEPVAQVLVQEGTLRTTRSDGVESLGSAGDVLAPGDSLKVPGRGEVELALVAGMKLRLVSGTAGAEFVIGEGHSEGELRSGTLLLAGKADAREGDVYSVKIGAALVSFEKRDLLAEMVLDGDGSLRATVARGRAQAMLPAGVQALNARQTLEVAPDGKLASPAGPAEKDVLERLWRWGKK